MDTYDLLLTLLGLAVLGAAAFPRLLGGLPVSMPTLYTGLGVAIFALLGFLPDPDPIRSQDIAERLTELGVIVALMGAGLKLDRPIGLRRWSSTWRLLGITMPLSIAAMAVLAWGVVGLAPATAILVGAALAPTDPVLASEVQVGPPGEGEEDEVRFALTSEAGLNDGLAFPFTNLAIATAAAGLAPGGWLGRWVLVDVVYRLGMGTAVGLAVGWLLARVLFEMPSVRLHESAEGFVALGATLAVYGLTELVGGYGFLAVFVAALVIRDYERTHEYHAVLHDFSEQAERLLMVALLLLFGGALATGILAALTWQAVVVGVVFLVAIRPVAGMIGLAGFAAPRPERWTMSFFGVRGVASFYYLAHGFNEAFFEDVEAAWAMVSFIVVVSIVVHGLTARPTMRALERRMPGGEG